MSEFELAGSQSHSCGYCQSGSSVSFGMTGRRLTAAHYQALLDRGWRRSGSYLYKPTNWKTCCPQYTIRLAGESFAPSKKQQKVRRRFERICGGLRGEKAAKPRPADPLGVLGQHLAARFGPALVEACGEVLSDAGAPAEASAKWKPMRAVDPRSAKKKARKGAAGAALASVEGSVVRLSCCAAVSIGKRRGMDVPGLQRSIGSALQKRLLLTRPGPPAPAALDLSCEPSGWLVLSVRWDFALALCGDALSAADAKAPRADAPPPPPPALADAMAVDGRDAREAKAKGPPSPGGERAGSEEAKRPFGLVGSVEELLALNDGRIELAVSVEPACVSEEKHLLYKRYQMAVHGDGAEDVTPRQFRHFLCQRPFAGAPDGPPVPLDASYGLEDGAYHMLYRANGVLIAVGVVDILPSCLSSVYCFYEPGLRDLSLGTLVALYEIDWVAQARARGGPRRALLRYYYLGYYIHSCPKMKYKGDFAPSEILCPATLRWRPLDAEARSMLDAAPFAVLCDPVPQPRMQGAAQGDPLRAREAALLERLGEAQMRDLVVGAGLDAARAKGGEELRELAARALRILYGEEAPEEEEEEGRTWIVPRESVRAKAMGLELHLASGAVVTPRDLTQESRRHVMPVLMDYVEAVGLRLADELKVGFR